MEKYLVICASSETGVCSIDPFNTEKEAQDFLKVNAQETYEEEQESFSEREINFKFEKSYAKMINEDYSLTWSIHSIKF